MCCCSRSSISVRIDKAACRNGINRLIDAAEVEEGDTHPAERIAGQIDNAGLGSDGQRPAELRQCACGVSVVEPKEPEFLTGICLSLQVMGVEREAEPQFEVAACLVQPALFVFDDAE